MSQGGAPEDNHAGHGEPTAPRPQGGDDATWERALYAAIPDLIFLNGRDGVFLDFHASDPELLKFPPEEFLGKSPRDLFPPELAERFMDAYAAALATGQIQHLTYSLPSEGKPCHFEARVVPCTPDRVMSLIRNITDEKHRHDSLLASAERFRLLSEDLHEFICELDAEGRFIYASPNYGKLAGYPPSELLGRYVIDMLDPEDRPHIAHITREIFRTGREVTGIQYRVRLKDGSERWMESDARILRTVAGSVSLGVTSRDISERKRAMDAIRESETRYRLLFDRAPLGLFHFDERGVIQACNASFVQIVGSSQEALTGFHMLDRVLNPGVKQSIRDALDGRIGFYRGEYHSVTGGKATFIQMYTYMLRDEGGRFLGNIGIVEDLTAQHDSEVALRASEANFRHLVEHAVDGILIGDRVGHIIQVNGKACQMTGYTKEELTRMNISELYSPDELLRAPLRPGLLEQNLTISTERDLQRKDGSRLPIEMNTKMLPDGRYQAFLRDISGRRQAEQQIRDSEERFRLVALQTAQIVFDYDIEHGVIKWAGAIEAITGETPESFETVDFVQWGSRVHPEDRARVLHEAEQAIATVSPCHMEYRFLHADGSYRHIEDRSAVLAGPDGSAYRMVGSMADVTRRKAAEAKMREAEDRFRGLCMYTTDNIFWIRVQEDGSFLLEGINPALEADLGMKNEEVAGRPLEAFLPLEMAERIIANYRRCLEGGVPYMYEEKRPTGDAVKTYETLLVPVVDQAGRIYRIVGTSRDITESVQTAEVLRQTQKLESLGVLAGGIAHDFNNLLTAIMGNLNLAQVKLSPESPAQPHLESMERIIIRAADLTKQMLAYSGRGRFVVKPHDLNEVLKEMTHLLQVSISKKVTLRHYLTPDLPSIEADAAQIQQVIMNLVTNASDAIGDQEGLIDISTRMQSLDKNAIRMGFPGQKLAPGRYVAMEVSDTGCGMSPEVQAKIFDPFFTTKSTGRGLGLSAMLGILRGHRAGIKIDSQVGRGTTFQVLFPVSQAETTAAAPPQQPRATSFSGTALLVDDEPVIQDATGAALKAMGFKVLLAKDGLEALQVYREHAPEINVVLLDLTMPRMDGREAFQELRRINPKVQVILSSGYTEADSIQELLGQGLAGFIQKPYRFGELKAAIAQCLGRA